MSKHTPEPWILRGIQDDHGATSVIAIVSEQSKGNTWHNIAAITSPHDDPRSGYELPAGDTFIDNEDWANARLIAASPRLLDVCRLMDSLSGEACMCDTGLYDEVFQLCPQCELRAAIAQAEGVRVPRDRD